MADVTPIPSPTPAPAPAPPAVDVGALINKTLSDLIAFYTDHVKGKPLNGNTVMAIVTEVASVFVQDVEPIITLSGPEKKALVVAAVVEFYKKVLEPLGIPGVPALLTNTLIDPLIERELPPLIGGVIDGLVAIFNKYGVGHFAKASI
jgi:hypothetical protein